LDQPILGENGNRNQPKDNPKMGIRTTLVQHPNTPFAFKRGTNAATREKGALFPK